MNGRNQTITPRNGHMPVVGIVVRTSCDEESGSYLQGEIELCRQAVTALHVGEVDYRVVAVVAHGNESWHEVEKLLCSGNLDLFVAADVSRLGRGAAATYLIGLAIDHGTRVLTCNDGIDTTASWETSLLVCANRKS